MGCDRRSISYPTPRSCGFDNGHYHGNRYDDDALACIDDGLCLVYEGIRDVDHGQYRKAERDLYMAAKEIETGLTKLRKHCRHH